MSFPMIDVPLENHTAYVTFYQTRANRTADEGQLLRAINDRQAALLLPDIAVTALLMLLGLVGNPLAIYIYGWRWQTSSTKIFLFSLAVIDLMNCLITIPTEVISMRYYYDFPSDGLCKASRFTTYVMNNATVIIFLSIAVDRYLRICHPYKTAVSSRSAKVACAVGLLLGLTVSWPALFLYGRVNIEVPDGSTPPRFVTGAMCLVPPRMERYSLAFFVYLCSAFFVCALILVVLYTLIGRAILKRKKLARLRKEATATALENLGGTKNGGSGGGREKEMNGLPGSGSCHSSSPPPPPPGHASATVTVARVRDCPLTATKEEGGVAPGENEEEAPPGCNVQNFSFHCKKLRPPRATLMLFLITVVFVTSFLPFLIISIIRQHQGPAFYLGLSSNELIVVNIFIRSYIVNNCTNPIVYGLCNSQFREECRRLYRAWCRKSDPGSASSNSHPNSHPNSFLNRSRTLYETPKPDRKASPQHSSSPQIVG